MAARTECESSQMPPVTRIAPSDGWSALRLGELWEYRELVFFFTWRDLKVRYRQTMLGAAWAVMQPLFTMIVFSLLFGRVAKMPSDGIPYPLFSLAGLVPWTFFAHGLNASAASLVENAGVIRKVYFPRLAIPLASILAGLADLIIAFLLLLAIMAFYGVPLTARALYLPLFVLLAVISALGCGLWISTLNVRYRDFRYVLPFLTQFWMFATPVVYPSSILSEPWRTLFELNPMAGVVRGFRWALLGSEASPASGLLASTLAALVILILGVAYFRKMERTFADRI